jgi:hypothetical protein
MGAKLFLMHVPPIPMGQWDYCDADVTVTIRSDAEAKGRLLIVPTGAQAELLVRTGRCG